LVQAGGAIALAENTLSVDALAEELQAILTNERRAIQMAQAALSEGKPDATQALVDMVEKLGHKAGD
jgi:UDP-N-acetylglucosamine--N-acetylmuramyl-(pentapeptide) pyrophosphoryl-undecaprenol N-acetylglucosamine transferase